jgi:peptidoglycan/LPS O-acetylase OafA/YrhL
MQIRRPRQWQIHMLKTLHKIRGVAAFAVVISHLTKWPAFLPGSRWSPIVTQLGQEAVAVFFVISGFIIAWSHRQEVGRPERLPSYLIKRAFRIYPAYWLFCLLFWFILWSGFKSYSTDPPVHRSVAETLIAIFLVPSKSQSSDFLDVAWSLHFEIFFYLLFTTFFFDRRIGIGILCLLALTSLARHPIWGIPDFFFSGINLCFIFGSIMGFRPDLLVWLRIPPWVYFLGAGICYGFLAWLQWSFHSPCSLIFAILLVAGAVLTDYQSKDEPAKEEGKTGRTLIWAGTISYSLYLCHLPIAVVIRTAIGQPASAINAIITVLAPLAVAYLSYLAVERPMQRLAHRLTGKIAPHSSR